MNLQIEKQKFIEKLRNPKQEDIERMSYQYSLFKANIKKFLPEIAKENYKSFFSEMLYHKWLSGFEQYDVEILRNSIIINESSYNLNSNAQSKPLIFATFHLGSYRLFNSFLFENGFKMVLIIDETVYITQQADILNNVKPLLKNNSKADFIILNVKDRTSIFKLKKLISEGYVMSVYLDGNTGLTRVLSNEFEKGFAKVELVVVYENTLKITNNLGQGYYYLKLNKAVVYENYEEIKQLIAQNPIAPQVLTQFAFSRKDDDKLPELFKVKTQSQIGYPYRELIMRWNYNLSEQRVELETYKKESHIVEYKNFTPNRIYFVPKVLHYDDKEVLIHFKHDLAESSPYFFQVLDAQTGEVKFTLQSNKEMTYLNSSEVAKIKEGYLIGRYDAYILNTKEGKLEKSELREKLTQR